MFNKEIDKLFDKDLRLYIEFFDRHDISSLRNVIDKEIRSRRLLLCFPDRLEELYQEYYFFKTINRIRIMLIFGIIVYLSFGFADYVLFPQMYQELWGIRLFVLAILLPTLFYILFSKNYRMVYWIYCFVALVAGISIVGMMFILPPTEAQIYYAGLFLVIFFLYTLSGLPFIFSAIDSWTIAFVYFLIDLFFLHSPEKYLAANMFFVSSANILGMIGGYILEYYIRKDFLLSLKVHLDKKEVESLNRKLRYMSNHDELTGLANRRRLKEVFRQELKRAVRERIPVAVLMIDIDYFKAYNDSYGHLKGDFALKEVGRIIGRHARRPADIVSRWGGEEFVVVLSNTDEKQAYQVASAIHRDVLDKNIEHTSSPFKKLTVSIGGFSDIPDNVRTIDEFLSRADKALYRAKETGRNRVVVYNGKL
ncbi:GGDEF domain-containing protein [Persephonella sp.]